MFVDQRGRGRDSDSKTVRVVPLLVQVDDSWGSTGNGLGRWKTRKKKKERIISKMAVREKGRERDKRGGEKRVKRERQ